MSLWNRIFGSKPVDEDLVEGAPLPPEEVYSELREISTRYHNALTISDPVKKTTDLNWVANAAKGFFEHPRDIVRRNAMNFCGLAFFHLKQFHQALEVFLPLAEQTNSPSDWQNVLSSAVLGGDFELGSRAYDRALAAIDAEGSSQSINFVSLTYYYACAMYDRQRPRESVALFSKVLPVYTDLKITDSTFLHVRGLPPFHEVLGRLVRSSKAAGLQLDTKSLLEDIQRNVDSEGQYVVARALEDLLGK